MDSDEDGKSMKVTLGIVASPCKEDLQSTNFPEILAIRHGNLDGNADFLQLRSQLEAFLQDSKLPLLSQKLHIGKSYKWKQILYTTLTAHLREIALTDCPPDQFRLLQQVKKWYWEKVSQESPSLLPSPQHSYTKPIFRSLSTVKKTRLELLEEFKRRKLDSVIPIEARSLSPRKGQQSPIRPRAVPLGKHLYQLRAQTRLKSRTVSSHVGHMEEFLRQKRSDRKIALLYKKQMETWGCAKSREEEINTSKAETTPLKELGSDSPGKNNATTEGPRIIDFREDAEKVSSRRDLSSLNSSERFPKLHQFQVLRKDTIALNTDLDDSQTFADSVSFSTLFSSGKQQQLTPLAKDCSPDTQKQVSPKYGSVISWGTKVNELANTKRKLALNNLPCTYRTLAEGLLEPSFLTKDQLTPESLPTGGELFTRDPFSDLGKPNRKLKKRR